MKRLLLILTLFCLFSPNVHANMGLEQTLQDGDSGECGENCRWTFSNGKVRVFPADSSQPAILDDYSTKISPWDGQENITSLVIENGVSSIGYWAFIGLSNLSNLEIADSVTEVGFWAFMASDAKKITMSSGNLARYFSAAGNGYIIKNLESISCTDSVEACQQVLQARGYDNLISHVKLAEKREKKRIYTVEEAEKLSKPQNNKFKIKYK